MSIIASRINSSGTYFVNGTFDEVTTSTIRLTTSTHYAAQFDEVTYNSTNPAIKNLIRYTEQFNNASWSKTRSSISAIDTITAPNGTLTAEKLSEDTTVNNNHLIVSNTIAVTSGTRYTGSVYIKAAERNFSFVIFGTGASPALGVSSVSVNLSTGAVAFAAGSVNSFSSIAVGDGWYRVSVTATAHSTGNSNFNVYTSLDGVWANRMYTGDGTSGIYIWGAQVEQNSTATIYQGIAAANTLVAPGFVKRETSDGTSYVTGAFDEFTGAPVVDSSLVLWLDAAQSTSYSGTGTTAVDISPAINSGTLIGTIPFNTSDSGGSFSFDGGNNYIGNFVTPLVRTGSRTIESWFQISTNAVRMGLAGDRDGTGWIFCVNRNGNGSLSYNHAGAGGAEDFNFAANVPVNTWTNAVATYDVASATVTIYMNGNLLGTVSSFTPIIPATTPVSYIGWETNSSKFQGKIAATKIYNRALTADEVQQNFNALRRRYSI